MEENPPAIGVNWVSNLEVAFRSIAWLWALHFFEESTHLTPDIFLRVLKYLYLHGRHLETYLSTYVSPNTHLTGEALGLFYLGTLLPELKCAGRWRAVERVSCSNVSRARQTRRHVFEQTSYYTLHDGFLHALPHSFAGKQYPSGRRSKKARGAAVHLMYVTKPDARRRFSATTTAGGWRCWMKARRTTSAPRSRLGRRSSGEAITNTSPARSRKKRCGCSARKACARSTRSPRGPRRKPRALFPTAVTT